MVTHERAASRRGWPLAFAALGLLGVLITLHIGLGRVAVPPLAVWQSLASIVTEPAADLDAGARHIVVNVRAPRTVVAICAGALLAVAGAVMQCITRNELADPGLLGVTPAAVLGVVVALVMTGGSVALGALPPIALAGALAGGTVVYLIGWRGGADPLRLVLTGVLLAAVLSAGTTVMLVRSGDALGAVFRWVIGSLHARTWAEAQLVAVGALVIAPAAVATARIAGLLQLGDDVARGRGLAVEPARLAVFTIAAAATAVAVSVTGALAFLGLVAPHITRRMAGLGMARMLIGSAIVGALLLVGADVIATTLTLEVNPRGAVERAVLPVGSLTTAIGAVFLLSLLRREPTR